MSSPDTYSSPQPSMAEPTSTPSGQEERSASRGAVRQTAEKARRATGKVLGQAKDKMGKLAQDGQQTAAGKIGGYSDRLRDTASSMEEEDPNIAHFTNQAADRLQQVADYVRDADFSRLQADASALARRHPVLFMGGLLAAGLVLGNLAKASVQGLRDETDDDEVASEDVGNSRYFAEEEPMEGASGPYGYGDEPERHETFS
jgi:hypothetical protein